jgi:predicted Zn-dependent peptidase
MEIKKTNDKLYYDTLDNGLQVFLIPKDNVNTTFVSFNVKYGSMYNEIVPLDEKQMVKFPNGIAHFLEHKMFEQENGIDPMIFYASNGADVNAYTSLYNTAYHFSCSSHLKENIEYLLDFVQAPFFTDENVLKEKGIIEEEILMYNDDPYSYLDERIRFNAFNIHPIRYSIAGTVDDVNSITKEDLYRCYHTFYHPTNMFLVVSGNFDVDTLMNVIKENQQKKEFKKKGTITIKKNNEKDEVFNEYEEKQMNVEVPKISYGIKIPINNIKMDPKRRDLYLAILFDSLFGSTSTFNEEMRKKGILLSYAMIDTNYTDTHLFITISADTEFVAELIKEITDTLSKIEVSDEDFNNKKKLFISNNIYIYEDVDAINRTIVNDLVLYGKYYFNIDDIIASMSQNEFNELKRQLNFDHSCILVINPITKKGN